MIAVLLAIIIIFKCLYINLYLKCLKNDNKGIDKAKMINRNKDKYTKLEIQKAQQKL